MIVHVMASIGLMTILILLLKPQDTFFKNLRGLSKWDYYIFKVSNELISIHFFLKSNLFIILATKISYITYRKMGNYGR